MGVIGAGSDDLGGGMGISPSGSKTSSSSSSSWPTFDEMASSILSTQSTPEALSKSSSASLDLMQSDSPMEAASSSSSSSSGSSFGVIEPELSMMDYAWNEDNIEIDFMTGKETTEKRKTMISQMF